jgi:hypothetical protein
MGIAGEGGALGFLLKFLTLRPIWTSFFCMLDYIDFFQSVAKSLIEVVVVRDWRLIGR